MINLQKGSKRWTVTLNRPDKANALSLDMLKRLDDIFTEAQAEQDLRILVITGAGERVFCAGADLAEARDATAITTNPIWESVSRRLANLPCLTIAALNGTLAGGGFGVALAADLRIAVPTAKFFYPVLKNGFLPQPSDVMRMRNLIGPSKTKMILLAGQKLKAESALAIGLIDEICQHSAFNSRLAELAEAAENAKPEVLTSIKRMGDADISESRLKDCFAAVYELDEKALIRLRDY